MTSLIDSKIAVEAGYSSQCLFEQISRIQGITKELHPSDYHVLKWNGVGNTQGNMTYRIYSLAQL